MSNKKRVNLVVVAHPDDEILGIGATGFELSLRGEIIQPIILCGHADVRNKRPETINLQADISKANKVVNFSEPILFDFPNIRMNTVPLVEIVQSIEKYIEVYQPVRIFTHHPADLNDDHLQVSKACLAASRLFQRRADIQPIENLFYMEILSSTEWAFPGGGAIFQPTHFFDIDTSIEKKISALKCYRDVMRPAPHPRSTEAIKALATYRGAQSGYKYAEAFQIAFQRGI